MKSQFSNAAMNIYLVGYRCTGKSTVGKRLAERMNLRFVDADTELVAEQGRSVAQLVGESGWKEFRKQEKRMLDQLNRSNNQVIATGGGVVLDKENIASMKKNGPVIWLRASPETIFTRMHGDENSAFQRPSLTDESPWDEVNKTLSERIPLYETAMDGFVDTDNKSVEVICAEILMFLSELPKEKKNYR